MRGPIPRLWSGVVYYILYVVQPYILSCRFSSHFTYYSLCVYMTNLLQKKSFDLVVDLALARAGDAGVTLRTSRAMVRDAMRCDATSTRWATRCDAMCDDEEWDDTTASSMGVDRARATTTAATTAAIARVVIQRGSSRGWCADIGRARARATTAMGARARRRRRWGVFLSIGAAR